MDTAAAKKRCEAATEGPWRAGYEDGSAPDEVMTVAEHRHQTAVGIKMESGKTKRGRYVSLTRDDSVPPLTFPPMSDAICDIDDALPEAERLGNAEFIAHAREDLPAALKALEEAQATQRLADEAIGHASIALGERAREVELLKRERDEARQERRSP